MIAPLLEVAMDEVFIPLKGELLVRRTNQDDARTAVRFLTSGPGGAQQPVAATGVYPLLPSPMVRVVASGISFARIKRMKSSLAGAWITGCANVSIPAKIASRARISFEM